MKRFILALMCLFLFVGSVQAALFPGIKAKRDARQSQRQCNRSERLNSRASANAHQAKVGGWKYTNHNAMEGYGSAGSTSYGSAGSTSYGSAGLVPIAETSICPNCVGN